MKKLVCNGNLAKEIIEIIMKVGKIKWKNKKI